MIANWIVIAIQAALLVTGIALIVFNDRLHRKIEIYEAKVDAQNELFKLIKDMLEIMTEENGE